MSWVRIDDQGPEHPKFLALGPSRVACTGLWLIALTYANRYLTDGFVPAVALPTGTAALQKRLVSVGLWESVPGGFAIHDYLDYQPSRKVVEDRRAHLHEIRSEAGRVGGIRSAQVRRSKANEANTKQFASKQTKQDRSPNPTQPPPIGREGLVEGVWGRGDNAAAATPGGTSAVAPTEVTQPEPDLNQRRELARQIREAKVDSLHRRFRATFDREYGHLYRTRPS